jgi:hypothetical protein
MNFMWYDVLLHSKVDTVETKMKDAKFKGTKLTTSS